MFLDFSEDFYCTDNLEPLTLRTSGRIPSAPDQSIATARGHMAEYKDPDQAGGNVLEGDKFFVWPYLQTPIQPPLGSLLIDSDGNSWTILSIVNKPLPLNVYTAQTRNLVVFNALYDIAYVYEATYIKSPAGEALATYAPILINGNATIPARFQPSTQDAEILEDAEWPKTTFSVILGVDIFDPQIPVEPASADFHLVDSAGRHYRIMSYKRAERIDALPIATCVLIVEGSEGGAVDRLASSSSSSGSSGS